MNYTPQTIRKSRPFELVLAVLVIPISFGLALPTRTDAGSRSSARVESATESHAASSQAIPFSLKTTESTHWRLRDHVGDVIILEWLDPECPVVARQHSPQGTIALVAEQTNGTQGVAWVGINSSHSSAPASSIEITAQAKERLGIEYPVALDPTGWVGRAYGVTRAAHVVVIDPEGRIVYSGAPDDHTGRGRLLRAIQAADGGDKQPLPPLDAYGCAVRYAPDVRVGAALPPFAMWVGSDLRVTSRQLLGQPFVMEWSDPDEEAWKAAHSEKGALASEPRAWRDGGARWLLVHPCETISESKSRGSYEDQVRAALTAACPAGQTVHDPGHELTRQLGATAIPELLVVDRRGVLVYAGAHDAATQEGRSTLAVIRETLLESSRPEISPVRTPPSGSPIE